MKKAIYHFCLLFFLSLLLLFSIIDISAQITFQKTFGGTGNDGGYSLIATYDGGYVITGYTESYGAGNKDVCLLKIDGTGNLLWSKTYGGNLDDFARAVIQLPDSGFAILGSTYSFGAGNKDIYLIRTDKTGLLLWSKTYGGSNQERGISIERTTDGGFIIGGSSISYGQGLKDAYLIKTDAIGNISWTATYGGSLADNCLHVMQTFDGGYIFTGPQTSFGAGVYDYFLVKVNNLGNLQWSKSIGGSSEDHSRIVRQTVDSGFVVIGHTSTWGAGSSDVFLVKTDISGNLLWAKTYGGNSMEYLGNIIITSDNGFLISGWTSSYGNGQRDIFMLKTDSIGNFLWAKAYGGANTDDILWGGGNLVEQTIDGGFICTGKSNSFGFGGNDIYLIKTDSAGNSPCNQVSFTPSISNPTPQVSNVSPGISSGGVTTNPLTIVTSPAIPDSTLCFNCTVSLSLSGNTSICSGDSATLNASGGISYLWSTGDTTPSITVSPLVTTTYLVTVSDSACFAIDSVTISILASFDDTVYVTICIGDSIFAGGSYQSASGTYYDTLAANNGCDSMITTNLSVVSEFITNINSAICEGDSLFIAGDYQTTAGTYYDTTLSAGGCDSIIISTLSIIQQVAVTLNSAICTGDSIFAGGGYQSSSGTYYDSLFTVNGCDSIVILNLSVYPGTSANAERDTTIKRGEIVQLFGSGGLNYSWSPSDWLSCTDCPDPIASPLITTTYCVTVSDINGCTDEDCITIIVEELICDDPFVPNVFSPNGDNNNDIVYVRGNNFIIEKFIIYDRWGEKVFETTNINQGWDGAFRGTALNPAVFVYYLETTCTGKDDIRIKKGNISLVR